MLKAILIGNLGSDPESRYTQTGKQIVQFSVAVNERRPTKDSGEWLDYTTWCRVKVMGRQAEWAAELTKGARVQVIGNLSEHPYIARDGEGRAGLEVFADEVTNLSPRDGGQVRDTRGDRDQPEPVGVTASRTVAADNLGEDGDLPF